MDIAEADAEATRHDRAVDFIKMVGRDRGTTSQTASLRSLLVRVSTFSIALKRLLVARARGGQLCSSRACSFGRVVVGGRASVRSTREKKKEESFRVDSSRLF